MNLSDLFGHIRRWYSIFIACYAKLWRYRQPREPNVVEWALSGEYDPDLAILIDASQPTRALSKRDVIELVTGFAGAFRPGQTVCLHLSNDILYPVLVLSILAAGATWTGTNTSYKASELEHHLRISRAICVVTSAENLGTLEAVVRRLDAKIEIILFSDVLQSDVKAGGGDMGYRSLHDLLNKPKGSFMSISNRLERVDASTYATLMTTSGTTGLPKMAAKTHRALVSESASDELYDSDKPYAIRRLFCTPIFHSYSFPKMVINPLRQGHPTYYMKRFDETFPNKIRQFRITDIITVPPILSRLVQQVDQGTTDRQSLQTLRTVLCAGAPLAQSVRADFLRLFDSGLALAQEWGLTECGCITRMPWREEDTTGSAGRIVGGFQVRVDMTAPLRLDDGAETGELLARGPQVMSGYIGNANATTEAFTSGGWYRTGDVGYIDGPTGKVYILDRCKDIIKVNGWQISPAEIEAVTRCCPGIKDACVLSTGHGLDEHPRVFAVRNNEDVTEKGVKDHLGHQLARYKVARCDVTFIDDLPRAPSGKILRRVLRDRMEEADRSK